MTIDLVFITYNRLDYTKLALSSVLADPNKEFSLTIWDNASTDGTAEYLKSEVSDPRISDIVLYEKNIGQTAAVNKIWANSKAELLGKLDNDCIVTPGWTSTLAQAHKDIPNLGVVACWHFFPEDFDYQKAEHKIQRFGKHRIFRHPWTCGTGLLIKNETYRKFGPIRDRMTTRYWLNMASAGFINGFYYPLIYQEHMDDPMSRYCRINTDEGIRKYADISVGLKVRGFKTYADTVKWRELIIRNLLEDPFEAKYYLGWRRKLRALKGRVCMFLKNRDRDFS